MNMFKPVGAQNRQEYLSMLNPERRKIIDTLDNLIRSAAPKLKPVFSYNMLGYGNFKYTNYKNEIIDWPIVAVASQKNYVSVYVCAVKGDQYLGELYKDRLGKVNVGKSCIRFKKITDIDLDTLAEIVRTAQDSPGFVSSTTQ